MFFNYAFFQSLSCTKVYVYHLKYLKTSIQINQKSILKWTKSNTNATYESTEKFWSDIKDNIKM